MPLMTEVLPFTVNTAPVEIGPADHVRLAPYALLRTAGLPYTVLTALRPARSAQLIDQLTRSYRDQVRHRPLLEDSLYEVVPKLLDPETRRVALKLRRDVHAGRNVECRDQKLYTVSSLLSSDAQQAMQEWLACSREIVVQRAELDQVLPCELSDDVRPRMNRVFAGTHFRRGIGIASPGLREALDHTAKISPDPFALSKTERSMLRYAIRASSKTTPFSTFMSVARVQIRRHGTWAVDSTFSGDRYRYRVTLNRGIAARIYKEAFRACAVGLDVPLLLNQSIQRLEPGRIKALLSQYTLMNGRPWRQDRHSTLNLHSNLVDVLMQTAKETTLSDLLGRIKEAGLGHDQAAMFLEKCIDRGLVYPPVAVDAFVPNSAESIASQLAVIPGLEETAESLLAMADSVRLAAESEREFIQSERQIRELEQAALFHLHAKAQEPFQSVITEDCWLSGVTSQIERPTQELLAGVGEFLKTQVAFKDTYLYLRELFVKEFGLHGVCRNAQEFLLAATTRVDAWRQTDLDRLPNPVLSRPPAGVSVGFTAYVQPVKLIDERTGVESRTLVVNSVHEGIGWLAARLASDDDSDHRALAGSIRQWLCEAVAPAEPVELTVSGECNGLQSHCLLTSRVLDWPGEPLLPYRPSVALPDLNLRYNARSELLELTDSEGEPIALVYLGSVVPMPNWGLPFLLTTLAQPFYFKRPKINTPPLDGQSHDAVLRPRFTHRNLILVRETWWVRCSRIREKWLAQKSAQRLVDTALDCDSLKIPAQFFARAYQSFDAAIGDQPLDSRKPFWIDTRSPFCLTLLERMVEESEWLILTEVLPGANGVFTEIDGEPHVSELHVEMMITI